MKNLQTFVQEYHYCVLIIHRKLRISTPATNNLRYQHNSKPRVSCPLPFARFFATSMKLLSYVYSALIGPLRITGMIKLDFYPLQESQVRKFEALKSVVIIESSCNINETDSTWRLIKISSPFLMNVILNFSIDKLIYMPSSNFIVETTKHVMILAIIQ